MEFAAPGYAWLAVPVTLVLLLRLRGERIRGEQLRNFAEPHLLPGLVAAEPRTKTLLRLLCPAVVMLLLVAALMRPQWGVLDEDETASGLDILFALDLSRSMLADDVAPSRLGAAKAAVAEAVRESPGDRVGLIGFAGSAALLCPPTSDHEMLSRILAGVEVGTVAKGGSSLTSAVAEALRALPRGSGGRILVLISDGEDTAGEPPIAAVELDREGVKVVAAVVGTPAGALMPLPGGGFVKDRRGAVVMTRSDVERLKTIDPAVSQLSGDPSLTQRLRMARTGLRESPRKERRHRLKERYAIPLSAALLLWFPGMLLSRKGGWL